MARLSRWARSPYETDEDMEREREALAPIVDPCAMGTDAEIVVVTSGVRVDARMLDRVPSIQLLVTTTSGSDHLDLDEIAARGIQAARLPLARRDAVVEWVLGMLVLGLRRVGPLLDAAREGRWVREQLPALGGRCLGRSRVGVVGLGVIGRRLARTLSSLGVEVLGCDPRGVPDEVRPASLDEMLSSCDALTLHCDLNPTSRMLLGASELERSREGLVLVNTARGPCLDLTSAVEALHSGRLGALAVDVFPQEPYLGRDGPHPGLFYTPHAAGYHRGLAGLVRSGLVETVRAHVDGGLVPFPLHRGEAPMGVQVEDQPSAGSR